MRYLYSFMFCLIQIFILDRYEIECKVHLWALQTSVSRSIMVYVDVVLLWPVRVVQLNFRKWSDWKEIEKGLILM